MREEIGATPWILGLPVELLREIFKLAVPGIKEPGDWAPEYLYGPKHIPRLHAALRISHTCRRFRDVAEGYPRLWNLLSPRLPLAFIPTMIERGRAVGLHIHITDDSGGQSSLDACRKFLQLTAPVCADWTSLRISACQVIPFFEALSSQQIPPAFNRLKFLSLWDADTRHTPMCLLWLLELITAVGNTFSMNHAECVLHGTDGFPAAQFYRSLECYSHFDRLTTLNIILSANQYDSPTDRSRLPFPRLRRLQMQSGSYIRRIGILAYSCLRDMDMPMLEELLLDLGDPDPITTTDHTLQELVSLLEANRSSFGRLHSFALTILSDSRINSVECLLALMPSLQMLVLQGSCPPLFYSHLMHPDSTRVAPPLCMPSRSLRSVIYHGTECMSSQYVKALLRFLQDNGYGQIFLDILERPYYDPDMELEFPQLSSGNISLFWGTTDDYCPRAAWLSRYPYQMDTSQLV